MMMKNRIWILLILLLVGWNISHAQVKLSAVAGGGISDLQHGFPFSDNSDLPEYFITGAMMQLGASIGSTFRKEGILSWETQLMVRRSTLKNVPIDWDNADCSYLGQTRVCRSPFPRDYSNVYRWNYWSIIVPASLEFQVFGPIGWKIGGNAHFLLSKFPEEDTYRISGGDPNRDTQFKSINWQGHIGFFARLGPKTQLEALAYSDILPRLTYGEYLPDGRPVHPEHREMGLYLNVLYRLF